jgi:membrane protease YdiL (CAAX protease family)
VGDLAPPGGVHALGILTIPYLVVVHTVLGYFFVTSWRQTGNLAAPGIAHAVIDACEMRSRSCDPRT